MPRIRMPAIYGKVREILPQKRAEDPEAFKGRWQRFIKNDVGIRKNSPVSTTQPDKKKICVEKTSNGWTCSVR